MDGGSERRRRRGEGGYGRAEQEKAGAGMGSSFIALPPSFGRAVQSTVAIPADGCNGATFGAISPSGHSCNSCNNSPPTVQQLQQLPADSETF